MGPQFLFMDDNAPCHDTIAGEEPLESRVIESIDSLSRSLDQNLIEHV